MTEIRRTTDGADLRGGALLARMRLTGSSSNPGTGASRTRTALWILLLCYAASRALQPFAGKIPLLVIVMMHVIPPALFALIHGAVRYRLRGILAFMAICLVVGN